MSPGMLQKLLMLSITHARSPISIAFFSTNISFHTFSILTLHSFAFIISLLFKYSFYVHVVAFFYPLKTTGQLSKAHQRWIFKLLTREQFMTIIIMNPGCGPSIFLCDLLVVSLSTNFIHIHSTNRSSLSHVWYWQTLNWIIVQPFAKWFHSHGVDGNCKVHAYCL